MAFSDFKGLRKPGKSTLNIYMCNFLAAECRWGVAAFPVDVKLFPEDDGIIVANPFSASNITW